MSRVVTITQHVHYNNICTNNCIYNNIIYTLCYHYYYCREERLIGDNGLRRRLYIVDECCAWFVETLSHVNRAFFFRVNVTRKSARQFHGKSFWMTVKHAYYTIKSFSSDDLCTTNPFPKTRIPNAPPNIRRAVISGIQPLEK